MKALAYVHVTAPGEIDGGRRPSPVKAKARVDQSDDPSDPPSSGKSGRLPREAGEERYAWVAARIALAA
jgi:hypothetical protein